ncbi:YihY/virulence factor BrkB family protein [Terricaulis sp.]|uniref:YihY/virulence factor BrkB family protein n=1 Tax=Terricaulis sp. TaxID=2768686 RepID=UPI003783CB68
MTDTTASPAAPSVSGPFSLSPAQWWCVARGVRATARRTNLALISAGVAFFGLMAVIPGVAALVSLIGLFADPHLVAQMVGAMRGVAPDAAVSIITDQVRRLLETRSDALLAGTFINVIISLWSALQGTRVVLMALTLVNRRAEQRSAFRRYVQAGVFTLYGMALSLLAVLVMGVAPVALAFLHFDSGMEVLLLVLRWPVLGGAAIAVALILYRWGPRRRAPPWRWLWPGAVGAPLLWVLASSAFTFALREFPGFGAAYGSLASGVALLLWLYLTAFVFLLGGALNAELEFFAQGRPTAPVARNEVIEPQTSVTGGKKETARPAAAPSPTTPSAD